MQWGGGVIFPGKKRYEGVRFNEGVGGAVKLKFSG